MGQRSQASPLPVLLSRSNPNVFSRVNSSRPFITDWRVCTMNVDDCESRKRNRDEFYFLFLFYSLFLSFCFYFVFITWREYSEWSVFPNIHWERDNLLIKKWWIYSMRLLIASSSSNRYFVSSDSCSINYLHMIINSMRLIQIWIINTSQYIM